MVMKWEKWTIIITKTKMKTGEEIMKTIVENNVWKWRSIIWKPMAMK